MNKAFHVLLKVLKGKSRYKYSMVGIYSASLQYSLQQGTVYVNLHQEQSFVAHLTIQNDVQHIYHNN